jgi:hypothetical protein
MSGCQIRSEDTGLKNFNSKINYSHTTYTGYLFLIEKFHGVALAVSFHQFYLTIGSPPEVSIANDFKLVKSNTSDQRYLPLSFAHVFIDGLSLFLFGEL